MTVENIENLIKQAEAAENQQAEQQKQADPEYKSAAEIREECQQKAIWIISGFEALVTKVKPEAAQMTFDDERMKAGVDKLAAVLEKYPGAELPPWLARLMVWREEFECGLWFAGAFYGVYKADEYLKAKQAEAEENNNAQEVENNGQ